MTNFTSILMWSPRTLCSCCCCSVTKSCLTLWDPMDCSTSGFSVLHYLPKFAQTHVRWVSDAIQPSHPLSSPSPPAFNRSQDQGLFQWVSSSVRWPKYWSFSFSISSSKECSGLISFRMDWLDILAVQETLKSVLQHHSLKASTLLCSAFFMVQLSHYPVFHDHWKNHSFNYMHLCQQSDISAFLIHCLSSS